MTGVRELRDTRLAFAWANDQVRPFIKFGAVGLDPILADVVIFNLLMLGLSPGSLGGYGPLAVKVATVSVSTIFAWYEKVCGSFVNNINAPHG